jgi:hypothetical protein
MHAMALDQSALLEVLEGRAGWGAEPARRLDGDALARQRGVCGPDRIALTSWP